MQCLAGRFYPPQVRRPLDGSANFDSFRTITDRPCTAVPCRIQHVADQMVPSLVIPWIEPYEMALEWIKQEGLSKQYRDSKVPEKHRMWVDFESQDPSGWDTLLKIESNECPQLMEATHGQAVEKQVSILPSHDLISLILRQMALINSIARICRRFGNEIDIGDPYHWPILSVEFTGLKDYSRDLSAPFSVCSGSLV